MNKVNSKVNKVIFDIKDSYSFDDFHYAIKVEAYKNKEIYCTVFKNEYMIYSGDINIIINKLSKKHKKLNKKHKAINKFQIRFLKEPYNSDDLIEELNNYFINELDVIILENYLIEMNLKRIRYLKRITRETVRSIENDN